MTGQMNSTVGTFAWALRCYRVLPITHDDSDLATQWNRKPGDNEPPPLAALSGVNAGTQWFVAGGEYCREQHGDEAAIPKIPPMGVIQSGNHRGLIVNLTRPTPSIVPSLQLRSAI